LNELLSLQFKTPTNFVHVGHSIGGTIALSYALTYGSSSKSVLLVDPIGIPPYSSSEVNSLIQQASFLSKLGIFRAVASLVNLNGIPGGHSRKALYDNVYLQDKSMNAASIDA